MISSGCTGAGQTSEQKRQFLTPAQVESKTHTNILQASYMAGDMLAQGLKKRGMGPEASVLTASFVNIDDLDSSSRLGRLLSEQIGSRLAQHGLSVKEVKLRKQSVFIRENKGEFLLSRQLKDLVGDYNAATALVGTYSTTPLRIFVSARIIRTTDNTVLASHDYSMVQNAITRNLLQ